MLELERTYLIKYTPEDLLSCPMKEMIDVYIPKEHNHPTLRLRKNGDTYEMTKKEPISKGDFSKFLEQTIVLRPDEFEALQACPGKRVAKHRYVYNFNGKMCEIDIFQEKLSGLVLADFEFEDEIAKNRFTMPEFCLAEVTQEKMFVGGMLCSKSYADIKQALKEFNYTPLKI